jgi:biotin carboxyl carrier protein
MFEAIIGDHTQEFERKNGDFLINGEPLEVDVQKVGSQCWHILMGGKSHKLVVHELDADHHEVLLSINGKKSRVKIRSRLERLLKELGLENALETQIKDIKAPMPGLIHSIEVQPGEEVTVGQPLLILEAMKMENVIKSPVDTTIAQVHVEAGNTVDKNALLISFG